MSLVELQNDHWQVGILPETGASIAYARARFASGWRDALRSTPSDRFNKSSDTSSFIMLPWSNRIRGGILYYNDQTFQLRTVEDGTARHGDVRDRGWQVEQADATSIALTFNSGDDKDINWPFAFSARAEYALDGKSFVWTLALQNDDSRVMPGGFGFHPYFARPVDQYPIVTIPCSMAFELEDLMANDAPQPIPPRLDFRQPRTMEGKFDDVLTGRDMDAPIRIAFDYGALTMHADPLYQQIVIYTPDEPSFAIEPMTNVNDGFNLLAEGIDGHGVFVLQPGESATASVQVRIES